ncbi:LysM repeat (LysM) (PDB:1E0G) [Commensalibacter communis]|uniref:LysM repeat (LysM) n=1 Tax=Commensalibacter communis TaxID=2972786 RepID=A0A9W4TQJ2_9PROT|nr:hypothetical protein [Commensalibacter communis]CAI3956348.1 LysM repeat (LysM) (PDB:1E0G) [Commensalibacter communis]CAI3958385.1 LysM repeat (LysM) (PDB:1E0G) [Commensalibacter communis]CAI3958763.1 LysM repeat (LysM) (PDB:1E0G) [Commensalibacter communis]CAI3959423.1 LysM repeat (LysM) (PDB:1E0G) [Commensalibacter communis]CAI3959953.1 LysM repeat (LysM) (PDB:1E0G) [Commensalibacter communis]
MAKHRVNNHKGKGNKSHPSTGKTSNQHPVVGDKNHSKKNTNSKKTAPKVVKDTSTGLDKWKDTIDRAVGDPKWDVYDTYIKQTVNIYNQHLSSKYKDYPKLDWLTIKAMIWVETGAKHVQWKTMPIQIGKSTDPGLDDLLAAKGHGALIIPPELTNILNQYNKAAIRTNPRYNIAAGIGYLLMRTANFEDQSVEDPKGKPIIVLVGKDKTNNSLAALATTYHSTTEAMVKHNPKAKILHLGDKILVVPASRQVVITGWRKMGTKDIAERYNRGDKNYAIKLDYVLNKIIK